MYRTDINSRTAVKIGLVAVPSKLPYGLPYGSSSVPTDQHSASTQTLVLSAGRKYLLRGTSSLSCGLDKLIRASLASRIAYDHMSVVTVLPSHLEKGG